MQKRLSRIDPNDKDLPMTAHSSEWWWPRFVLERSIELLDLLLDIDLVLEQEPFHLLTFLWNQRPLNHPIISLFSSPDSQVLQHFPWSLKSWLVTNSGSSLRPESWTQKVWEARVVSRLGATLPRQCERALLGIFLQCCWEPLSLVLFAFSHKWLSTPTPREASWSYLALSASFSPLWHHSWNETHRGDGSFSFGLQSACQYIGPKGPSIMPGTRGVWWWFPDWLEHSWPFPMSPDSFCLWWPPLCCSDAWSVCSPEQNTIQHLFYPIKMFYYLSFLSCLCNWIPSFSIFMAAKGGGKW